MEITERPAYRGIPLYKDVIIITKDSRTIIGLFQKVTPDEKKGDIIRICYEDGTLEHININDIEEIDLYIKEGNRMSKKEQLLNELEQIKNEFNEKIENIQKQIEQENNKNEWWIPKEGEGYYYICTDGYVQGALNTGADIDRCKINNINCYETGQQAERQAFEELLHRKLKKFAFENNAIVDWNNDDNKYDIWYDYEDKQFNTGCYESARDFAQIYFSSEEIAEKAIEEFKDDLIRYFTSDK